MSPAPATDAFIGFRDIRQQILRHLRKGSSVALLGGRKCGGSSFLQSLIEELPRADLTPLRPVPIWLNIREICPRTPLELFRNIYLKLAQGVETPAWEVAPSESGYQQFLRHLHQARPALDLAHGPRWVAIMCLDPLDLASQFLPDEEAFHNLRSLLTDSPFRSSFRLVAWGGSGMSSLIRISSPLNNLQPKFMRVWTEEEALEYIRCRHPGVLTPAMEQVALQLSGRHPYLLLGLMRKIEDGSFEPDKSALELYGRSFMRDRRGVFENWLEEFGVTGREVYSALRDAPDGTLTFDQLRVRVTNPEDVEEAILKLSYHCVVDATDPDRPRAEGQMFAEWFQRNSTPEQAAQPRPAATARRRSETARGRKVFVVHGRDERTRTAMFTFLRALKLEPIEWHHAVEATGNAAPHISDILDSGFEVATAAVVLLTPDDEARLKDKYVTPTDPDYERDATGQPRPNVLFEAGMAWAKFPRRTIFVQVGRIRPFSDMAGIHMIVMDGSLKRRRELASRLRLAGCDITDLDASTDWQEAGSFDDLSRA